jgi:hypothetical protein
MAQHNSRFTVITKTRSESGAVSWTLCEIGGCPGEAVPNQPYCLIHLSDDDRRAYLREAAQGNQPLTLSGLSVSGLLLSAVFAAMPTTDENRRLFPTPVRCNETTFLEYVDAQNVTFADTCSLINATFQAGAIWNGSVFNGGLDMRGCRISGDRAKFSNVRVRQRADLAALVCQPLLVLVGLIVEGPLDLRAAKCGGLWLSKGVLTGEANLEGARLAEQFQDEVSIQVLADSRLVAGTVGGTSSSACIVRER